MLEELNRYQLRVGDRTWLLIDEIDLITGASPAGVSRRFPTRFTGGELLRQSPVYQEVLQQIGAEPVD